MENAQIFSMIRAALTVLNTYAQTFNMHDSDKNLAKEFITFCGDTVEDVPQEVADAWEAIPDEWLKGEIPEGEPAIEEVPEERIHKRAAIRKTGGILRGADGKCATFGKFKKTRKRCEHCLEEFPEEHAECLKETERLEEERKELIKERVRRKNATITRIRKSANLSRFGHRENSMSAFLDEELFTGCQHEDLVKKLLAAFPDVTEDHARTKIRDHINYLPKKRGITVNIILEDNVDPYYKIDAETWIGEPNLVVPVTNTIQDNRSKRPHRLAETNKKPRTPMVGKNGRKARKNKAGTMKEENIIPHTEPEETTEAVEA